MEKLRMLSTLWHIPTVHYQSCEAANEIVTGATQSLGITASANIVWYVKFL